MVELYIKVAALNLAATVFDSDDLSTIRGSSLALLRFPTLLLDHLRELYSDRLSIEPLQASASETVVKLSSRGAKASRKRGEARPPAKRMSKSKWRAAISRAANEVANSADATSVRTVATTVFEEFDQLEDPSQIEVIIEQIETALADKQTSNEASIDLAALEPDIVQACREFAKRRIDGWSFDCFTIAVASLLNRHGFKLPKVFAVLDNRLRQQQQRSLTVPLPAQGPTPLPQASKAVCRVTRVLAAATDRPEPRSESVQLRRKGGAEQRQDFYEEQLRSAADQACKLIKILPVNTFRSHAEQTLREAANDLPVLADKLKFESLAFAKSFEDIVDQPPSYLPPGAKNKLALIQIDGNSFGALARERAGKDIADYKRYSLYLEAQGGLLLKSILEWMLMRPTMRVKGDAKCEEAYRLRFETLLWGGDEMLFVLPAWEAADFMTMLQASLKAWRVPELLKNERRLTFSAGMVIGYAKTPIRDLREVAYQLCNDAKTGHISESWIQVLSLEGMDRAEINPSAIRKAHLGAESGHVKHFNIYGSRWAELVETARTIASSLGQTQLHRQYREAEAKELIKAPGGLSEQAGGECRAMISRLQELGADSKATGTLATELFAASHDQWPFLPLHQLLMLWDFLTPGSPGALEKAA